MERKKLGVIGGMGPEASSFYYARVIAHTAAGRDQEHIDMVILSHASMPDRTEAIRSGDEEAFLAAIGEDVKALEALGCANIAIPCNTSHYFLPKIQAMTSVPIINMVEESAKAICRRFPEAKRVGILATDGTIGTGTYHRALEAVGLTPVVPSEERQKDVMSLIYEDIKAGDHGDRRKFDRVYADLEDQGCDVMLLACTELSVFKEYYDLPENCLDAMDILVRESVKRSGARYR
ncbi:MAG: aspartate/glutamate racemase family protein [Lachnospiraceae bacterium]|nr:aspartate/glutamate racemase family protein [Lachnospiraceae bacterium]MBR0153489.1 aspartate/glutamate racemase family protein [Lachnospiraceae bacterium]